METRQSTQLEHYRQALYTSFDRTADASMELLDALASQTNARSVTELSLEPPFRREYSSVYSAIGDFFKVAEAGEVAQARRKQEVEQMHLHAPYVLAPAERPYWLFVYRCDFQSPSIRSHTARPRLRVLAQQCGGQQTGHHWAQLLSAAGLAGESDWRPAVGSSIAHAADHNG